MQKKVLALATLISLSFAHSAFAASGFADPNLSPSLEGQAMAGAGAAVGDVTAIFINPAITSTISQKTLYLGATQSYNLLSVNNATGQVCKYQGFDCTSNMYDPVSGSSSQENVLKNTTSPVLYFAAPLNAHFSYGLAFNTPFAFSSEYDADSTLRYLAVQTQFQTYATTGILSYRLNPSWSFGAGLEAEQIGFNVSHYDFGLIPDPTDPNSISPAASQYNASNWGYGYTLGMLYQENEVIVGLSYRSQINTTLHGNGSQYTTGNNTSCGYSNGQYTDASNCPTGITASVNTPAVLNMSLEDTLNSLWTLDASAEITFWNSFKQVSFSLPEAYLNNITWNPNWRNSVNFAVGSKYHWNSKLTLRDGMSYDTGATPDNELDPLMPISSNVLASIGASYRLTNNFSTDLSYSHTFFIGQNINTEENWGLLHPTPRPFNPPNPAVQEYNLASANFSGGINSISLGLSYAF
jgi:long-chain fatty acid transport protein